jgi:hypothetical protein
LLVVMILTSLRPGHVWQVPLLLKEGQSDGSGRSFRGRALPSSMACLSFLITVSGAAEGEPLHEVIVIQVAKDYSRLFWLVIMP